MQETERRTSTWKTQDEIMKHGVRT